jgi:hypothetical protein
MLRQSLRWLAGCTALLLLAACASMNPLQPTQPGPLPPNVDPPPPPINLSGFPLPYRQGYADGCASVTGAERKDSARYQSDGNYRTGWMDGVSLCRKK